MSARIQHNCLLLGGSIVLLYCVILIVSSIGFLLGISLNKYQFPIAIIIIVGIQRWASRVYYPEDKAPGFYLLLGTSTVILTSALFLCQAMTDISWDGQTYHADAVLRLTSGWNPFRQRAPSGTLFTSYLTIFAKGPWIAAASVVKLTGEFEHGKLFSLLLPMAAFLIAIPAIATFKGLSKLWIIALALLLAGNPVSLYQMFTFYVDGQLAALMGITVSLLILINHHATRANMILLSAIIILLINVKLNGALYMLILVCGFLVWTLYNRSSHSIEITASLIVGCLVGGILVGFNPYLTQFATMLLVGESLFYPESWQSLTVLGANSPPDFAEMGRLEKIFRSLFARSEASIVSSELKLPFTFSRTEFGMFLWPDVRLGGFGPLFSGVILLSLLAFIYQFHSTRHRLHRAGFLFVLLFLIISSGFSNPEAWWARYSPQTYLFPVFVILWLTCIPGRPLRMTQSLALVITLVLATNNLAVFVSHLALSHAAGSEISEQLIDIKNQSSQSKPVAVYFDYFAGTKYKFDKLKISYTEFTFQLPCNADQQMNLLYSEAIVCLP